MRFTPFSKEDAEKARSTLLPAGRYDALVRKATEKVSKSGNDMLELEVEVFHDEGSMIVFDYLLSTEKMIWRLRHFCEAAGLLDKYDTGTLTAEDCVDINIAVELEHDKPKDPKYQTRNRIKEYMPSQFGSNAAPAKKPEASRPAAKKSAPADDDDGSIPF